MEYLQYNLLTTMVKLNRLVVLNLIINGIPSIQLTDYDGKIKPFGSFKPYYKWNTFNTIRKLVISITSISCFKPYYKWNTFNTDDLDQMKSEIQSIRFKPYYKWNTFNTAIKENYDNANSAHKF